MGGFFGVAARDKCVADVFFGTDYHSHLGTQRGGMALRNGDAIHRVIHDITNAQFRSKFDEDLPTFHGNLGIGVISDFEDQPVLIGSHLGTYAVVTVGVIQNLDEIVAQAFKKGRRHFVEMSGGTFNPTEVVGAIISEEDSFEAGIERVHELVDGSCSLLLLTDEGLYAARDRFGRTAVVTGEKDGAYAVSMESSAFPNLDYQLERFLGPGEIVRLTPEGVEQLREPGEDLQICTFLWVYYGYPASYYEGINVEETRYRCGAALARADNVEVDVVAGIPDSGTAHAIGYANTAKLPYKRPFVKYTPTWPRSFMPQDQSVRDLVARMKLIPIRSMLAGQRIMFCEDSIVRGTQLQDIIRRLHDCDVNEIHMRPACPPLTFGCRYLNFSRSRSVLDLATRKAIKEIEGDENRYIDEYVDQHSDRHAAMVEYIRSRLGLTSLKYQKLTALVDAVGLPKSRLCTYCWDGCTGPCGQR